MSNETRFIFISVIPENYDYKLGGYLCDTGGAHSISCVTNLEKNLFNHIVVLLTLSKRSYSDIPYDALSYACQLIFDDLSSVGRYYVIKINNSSAVLFETKAWEGKPPEITDENSSAFIDLLPVRKTTY
jgi:hypothetical protein